MVLDIATAVLAKGDDFDSVIKELAQQLRELTGARTLVIMQTTGIGADKTDYRLLHIAPERRAKLLESPDAREFLEFAIKQDRPCTIKAAGNEDGSPAMLLRRLDLGTTMIIPLVIGTEQLGSLVAMGLMDLEWSDSLIQIQAVFSGIVAIILKNILLIEDRRQHTLELHNREILYHQMFAEHSAIMLLSDPVSGSIVEANQAAADFYGYSVQELQHMKIQQISTSSSNKVVMQHPKVLEGKRTNLVELHRFASGEVHNVEVHSVPIQVKGRSLLYSIIHDISDRVRALEEVRRYHDQLEALVEVRTTELANVNKELRKQIAESQLLERERRLLDNVIEQSAEDIIITNTDGEIQYVNPAFERITGYTRKEAVGKNPRFLKSGRHSEIFYNDLWETILRGNVWQGRIVNKQKDGRLITEDATISPMRDENGVITHFFATKRDLTYEVELEHQLRQIQKMEVIGQLAGGIAHDFNNILQSIQGYTQFLLDDLGTDSTEYGYAHEVYQESERAAALIRQLLAFSRRQFLEKKNLDINCLVQNLLKMIERILGEHIDLSFIAFHQSLNVNADASQLEQVVLNLCVNARDAMPDGGKLSIETERATLDEEYCMVHPWAKQGDYALLLVSDTGCGMNEETNAKIFEPFFTTKELGKGTGLGLATVYGIVKQHGGMIHVYSENGQGSTFKIYLPLLHETTIKATESKREGVIGGLETILLAEDEDTVRRLTARILEMAGYTVIQACDGEEAIEHIRVSHKKIDLLLSDVMMPKKGGRGVMAFFRKCKPSGHVLLMSGYSIGFKAGDESESMMIGFISKPFSSNELLRKVREQLDRA
ncbi:MAG: PAS domain S-box protein [Candidatus Aegiribacteria sp.]|nr:PAS domain S-box protein [Candidatus Aegiribacteria sp.]